MNSTNSKHQGPEAEGSRDSLAVCLLAAALLIGLSRFVRLGEWSLWLDEALTLADSLNADRGGLKNPLGYSVFGIYLDSLTSRPTEFDLRILPAIFGWLGIALTYWAFAPFAGRRVAATAALLVAVSAWHTYWSQTARFYTLTQDLSLLGSGLILRGLWRDSIFRVIAGLGIAVAACLAHYSGAFPLPVLIVLPFLLLRFKIEVPGVRGRAGKVLIGAGVVGILAGAPALLEVWRIWRAIHSGGTASHFVLTAGFFITPLMGVGLGIGAIYAFARRKPFEVLAVGVALLAFLEATIASCFARVSAQYIFVLLPWIALVVALPIGALKRGALTRTNLFPLAYLAVLVLPALTSVGLFLTVRKGERPMWRAAYRFVRNHQLADDLILGMEAPVGEFYLSPDNTNLRNQSQLAYLDSFRAKLPNRWARFDRRTWLVINLEQLEDWDREEAAEFKQLLAQNCKLVASYPLIVESRDLSVYVYLRE
ncbi:MAG: hypothetical protein ACI8TQ_000449 [Planctomycetota bacterium]